MSSEGKTFFKALTLIFLIISFAFIIVEQRIESQYLDRKAEILTKEIGDIELKKKEFGIYINKELTRLSSINYRDEYKPIGLKDIVTVNIDIDEPENNLVAKAKNTELNMFISSLYDFINKF